MNREREAQMYKDWEENIANSYEDEIDDTCFSAFLDGVKWADEHPKPDMVNKQEFMERVCDYLQAVLEHDLGYYGAIDFVDRFIKEMEE